MSKAETMAARMEELRRMRQLELQVLHDARQSCDPLDAVSWAGYWLKRWRGHGRILRGQRRGAMCSTISQTGTSPIALAHSAFLHST